LKKKIVVIGAGTGDTQRFRDRRCHEPANIE